MVEDPNWPRAAHWLNTSAPSPRFVVIGVPAHETSISTTRADATPPAVREALLRYSTYHRHLDVDLTDLPVRDLGDVDDPDHFEGELRVADAVRACPDDALLFAIGGDNSITASVMQGLLDVRHAGLVTLDAHHDLRDGMSNGSPVRRLLDAGLDPARVVQIGINDFSNSAFYARRARDLGITVISRAEVQERGMAACMATALRVAGSDGLPIYVDLDLDVCDRAVVPGCPAAAPGGISAGELRLASRLAGQHPQVRCIDATEVDAAADAPDQRTVRLLALALLEAAAGRLHALGSA